MTVYKCLTCQKTFSTKSNENAHHKKKNACSPADVDRVTYDCVCGKKFNQRNNLYRHKKDCTGPPPPSLEDQLKILQEKLDEFERADRAPAADDDDDDDLDIVRESDDAIVENNDNFIVKELEGPRWILPSCDPPKMIGDVDPGSPQLYILKPGPLLKPLVDVVGFPLKLGSSDHVYVRTMSSHKNDFGGVIVVDSIVCDNPSAVESKLKKWLNMQGRFVACKSEKKRSIEAEVIVVQDQADYERIYHKIVGYAEESRRETTDERDRQYMLLWAEMQALKDCIKPT